MSDIFSQTKRSDIMSKISSKDTKPEILVRKFLFSKGFRYRINVKVMFLKKLFGCMRMIREYTFPITVLK
jgi:G:T-mismatch repair DNA endonuclease (very short patch repair protein)